MASSLALGMLLVAGIGDTIRVSLTPRPGDPRKREVVICQQILQTLGLRSFAPVKTCAPFVLEAWSTLNQHPDVCELFNQVPAQRLQEGLAELEKLAGVAKKRRSIQRDPDRHLKDVLKKWMKS